MKIFPCFMFLTSLAMMPTAHAESEKKPFSADHDTSDLRVDEVLNNPQFASLPRDNPMLELLKAIEWYKTSYPHASESDVESFLLENQRGAEDLNSVYDQWTHLTASEKTLIISSPGNAALTVMTKDEAFELTTTHMGRNGLGDPSDAFRHAIWNALMSRYISKAWAYSYATAHESKTEEELNQIAPDGRAERQHREMDLFNNEKGRDCWSVFTDTMITTSDEDLVGRVKAKLNNGELTYFHN